MNRSVTQELEYGCGVACFAFICGMTFQQAIAYLGREYSVKYGWRPSDLVIALNNHGLPYKNTYVRKTPGAAFPIGTIVLIERSPAYPVGHYLALSEQGWMDPWLNLRDTTNVSLARSGFRTRLPGKPMYALVPISYST